MKKTAAIQLTDLAIGYAGRQGVRTVAQGITRTLCSGELTCLLGENGAGKSTLLKTLSAFLPPLSGEITLLGKSLRDYSEKELSRVIGVVLTERSNVQNMTVWELVGLGRSPYTGFWGRLSAEDRRKVSLALEMVGASALEGRLVQTLSDGERQKVMIAKALAQETPVIFLDEPTAFLDYPSKVEILQLLHRLSREMQKTVFLSTHDLELALQIADCLWLMARGRSIAAGAPEDLALDGTLDTFFQRSGVTFERRTGLYRIEPQYHSDLIVSGDPLACEMLRKALRRNGIRAVERTAETACALPAVHASFSAGGTPAFTLASRADAPDARTVHTVAALLELL